jgi:hypothetical protein
VVVVDVEVVVVDDVVVDVDGAVVTGTVVVESDGADVEVSCATDDDVEPTSVADEFLSLPQLASASAMRAKGSRRVDFTHEVWHAMYQLPDQGVGLVPTFNKL